MSSKAMMNCAFAALFCGFACGEPPEMPEVGELAQEPAADEEFRVSYSCAGGEEIYEFTSDLKRGFAFDDDETDPFYCLTRCEGHDEMSRARKTAIDDPSERTDSWCLSYAAYFCSRLERELESWCWGTREDEDEEDE